jgi:hypothetical protein
VNKKLITALIISSLLLSVTVPLMAQEPAKSMDDEQTIEQLKKKREEVKRQIREELQKQIKTLEEERDQLRRANSATSASAVSVPAQPASDNVGASVSAASDDTASPVATAPVINASATGNGQASSSTQPVVSAVNTPAAVAPPPAAGPPPAATAQPCTMVRALPTQFSRAERNMCALARVIVKRRQDSNDPSPTRGIDTTKEDLGLLVPIVLAQRIRASLPVDAAVKSLVVDVEAGRNDKQLGADAKAAGTTSLAVKGGIPQVFSWGVENGAAVASRDGTTLTFRVNPVGLIEALSGEGYITGFTKPGKDGVWRTQDDAVSGFFRRTSVGFSFDTTRGTDPPTFIGSKQQLSAVSFRYQFVNQRDPRHPRYRALWDEFFRNEALDFTDQQTKAFERLQKDTVKGELQNETLQNWVTATNVALKAKRTEATALEDPSIEEVRAILEEQAALLPVSELDKDLELTDAMTKFIAAYAPYLAKRKEIMDEVMKGTLVTFEYTNYREPNAPDLSNLRFVYEKGTKGGIDFTANASLTFYNKRPVGPDVQRLRDFDFSGQLDKKLDGVMGLGPAYLSFTGKYQRLTSNAVAFDGTILPNTKGDIAAGQIKLTIPLKDSGIKIPFSITFANRTELIREREVRGNFGFTFDVDTLFARFKSFTQN